MCLKRFNDKLWPLDCYYWKSFMLLQSSVIRFSLLCCSALPLFSLFTDDGNSKKSFLVCPAGESVEHFKQLLFCHLYRTQQWCNCCNFHFHWLCCPECFPGWNSACLWSAQVTLHESFHVSFSPQLSHSPQDTANCWLLVWSLIKVRSIALLVFGSAFDLNLDSY